MLPLEPPRLVWPLAAARCYAGDRMRVLVASVDAGRRERLVALLEAEHEVTVAADGGAALAAAARESFDLILLDLPDLEVCARLRHDRPAQPILVLAQGESPEARVAALRAGADDSMSAPFAGSQMIARVDALARRARLVAADPRVIEADGCRIDLDQLRAVRTTEVALTAREAAILAWLYRHRGRAVTRPELLASVWGVSPTMATRTVDVTVAKLRKKIERDPAAPRIVVGVKSVGYAWGFTQP
jgi:DNA-binding response OmpR family regulator